MNDLGTIAIRLLDAFIDSLIVMVIVFIPFGLFDWEFSYFQPVWLLALSAYSIGGQVWLGQTFAKAITGFTVVDSKLGPITFGQAVVRNLHFLLAGMALLVDQSTGGQMILRLALSVAIPLFIVVDILTLVLDSKSRSIRDRLAGTMVIKN